MNDKDNEAFESWWENIYDKSMQVKDWRSCENLHDNKYNMAKAWQAAIEYQQKEIEEDEDRLRNHMNSIGYRELKKLQDQNKKLRKALELCKQEATRPAYVINICKEALKEAGEE
jgi:hypothetical protein